MQDVRIIESKGWKTSIPCFRCHQKRGNVGYNVHLEEALDLATLPPLPDLDVYPTRAVLVTKYRWLCLDCLVEEGYTW